jgi:NitT/TauT family transport system substrate-binding protein
MVRRSARLRIGAGLLLGLLWAPLVSAAETSVAVDVSLGDVSINKVPFLVAADAGLYAKYGLEVHQFITPAAAAVARNSGVVVPDGYVRAEGGAPIVVGGGSPTMYRAVTRDGGKVTYVIVSTSEPIVSDHMVALPGIRTLEGLKGKRLGYSGAGTVTHFATLAFAKRMGWTPGKDVTLVPNAGTLGDLKDGKVDALLGSAMVFALGTQANYRDIGDLSSYRMPIAGSGIMVDKAWMARNRDTVLRFLKAATEATALMKRDRMVFDAALARWFNIRDAATRNGMFAVVAKFPAKPYPSVEGIKAVMATYNDVPAMRAHTAEDFYDSSLMAELDKSGFLDRLQ